jgi:hypothetical protein
MPPAPPTPVPGNLTVPPLFGWWEILVLLVVVVAVAVLAFLFLGAGPADSDRSEWRAFLDGRSRRPEPDDRTESVSAEHAFAEGAPDR